VHQIALLLREGERTGREIKGWWMGGKRKGREKGKKGRGGEGIKVETHISTLYQFLPTPLRLNSTTGGSGKSSVLGPLST